MNLACYETCETRGRDDSSYAWLPVTTGYQNFGFRVVTGYHCLPGFRFQGGYRLPLVTRIMVSWWLLVTIISV